MSGLLEPEEHVLPTLERDGSRRWLNPVLSSGRWWTRRRWVAWILVAVFTVVPFLKAGGRPLVLLDFPARRFILFGYAFLPTDTVLLALLAVGILLSVFVLTALFGRVWCGWACPQTVYMEFLIRPLERFFDGTAGRGGVSRRPRPAWFRALRYPAFLLACLYLANTFLAWFVGVERLGLWMTQSPFRHPAPFLVMTAATAAMMLDFCFYREQICILMCPYGRLQSVLLDPSSMIVSYDARRGEPRGKFRRNGREDGSLPVLGDCIDCGRCVATCPTGIDIRGGLQMECIHCTQCIDACNAVMEKTGRAPDLIRYSSQRRDRGERSGFRPRLVLYPLLLTVVFTLLGWGLLGKKPFDAVAVRELGSPWSAVDGASTGNDPNRRQIRNLMRIKLTNRGRDSSGYRVTLIRPEGVELRLREAGQSIAAGESATWHMELLADRGIFAGGRADCRVRIEADDGSWRDLDFKLLGPRPAPEPRRDPDP